MDAGSGYSSDPTTSTSSRDFGRNNDDEQHFHHDQHDHIPSFSSLHNRAHLQSTPAKTARLPLHRVDRAGNPASIVASSASESQSHTEEEEVDGEMEDNATELGGPRGAGGQTGAAAGTRVREYWGRLLQEAEESKVNAESHLGVPAARRQPPSTGSSTLVDQESLTGRGPGASKRIPSAPQMTLERPVSAPPVAYESTPGPSRLSPLQDHVSRFISSTSSDPYVPAHPPSPPSLSHRGDLSRISSHNNNTNSSSAIASRVHDIFAKHIHSASISSTARSTPASRSTERRLPPRQRLRDLLGESNPNSSRHTHTRTPSSQKTYTSESEGESIQEPQRAYRDSSATARISPKRRREGSNTPRAGPSRRLISKLPNTAASTSRSRMEPANESRSYVNSQAERHNFEGEYDTSVQRQSANGSRQHASRSNHTRRVSGSLAEREFRPDSPLRRESRHNTSQLSREWYSIRQQEQSRQYAEALEHIQGSSRDEEEQLEDQQSQAEYRSSEIEDEGRQAQMQSDSDPGYSPEPELDPPRRSEASSSKTRTAEMGPEEEASSLSHSEREDERYVSYVQQQRISPRLGTLSYFRRSANGDSSGLHDESMPSETVQVATSTPRAASRVINRSFGNSTRAPKTPHPPGAYFSSTPSTTFVGGSPSKRQVEEDSFVDRRGNETAEASRSRFLTTANYSVAPKIPGGYSPPFPRPRKSGVPKDERDTVPLSTPSKNRQSLLASSSTSPSRKDSRARELDNDGSPARQRRSPRTEPKHPSPLDAIRSPKAAESPSTPRKDRVSPQGTPRTRTESGDTTLQSMFTDLVKPLKNLLVGLHTPPKPLSKAIASIPTVKKEDEFLGNEETLVERKKRRLEHDHILARLSEADRIDRSLATRIDEMRKAVDEMGQRLSSQVSSVISESFVQEAKRRKMWFCLLILGQFLLLYLVISYANERANQLHQTTYFDPFFPALLDPTYHESRLSSSPSFFRTSHPLYSSSSGSTNNNEKSWYTFLRVLEYALYAIRDNMGFSGSRTDFVHGTFEHAVTKAVTAAAVSDATAVFRIPT